MNNTQGQDGSRIIAVYPDRASADGALRRLDDVRFDMRDVSVIGPGVQGTGPPAGAETTGDVAERGATIGAIAGGLAGLAFGTALIVLPIAGPVFIAGPLFAALAGGAEGAIAGGVIGGLGGALAGWGVPEASARGYEHHVKQGKFLVVVRGNAARIDQAQPALAPGASECVRFDAAPA